VEVVNGGAGLRRLGLRSTRATTRLPAAAAISVRSTSRAWASSVIEKRPFCVSASTLSPRYSTSRAGKRAASFTPRASTVQYSCRRKAAISSSRSQMSRSATLCTRPADRPGLILRHSSGERLKPTR
jgi:hypothetical protein